MCIMPKFELTGIEWDCDDAADYGLPTDTVVVCDSEYDVADALSDEYGWCVNTIETITEI